MPNYNVDSLQAGIENCKKNIQIFEEAIRKERETISTYTFYIIQTLQKKKSEEERLVEVKKTDQVESKE